MLFQKQFNILRKKSSAICPSYIDLLACGNMHHEAECIFKGVAKCVQDAVRIVSDSVPSSKGVL